MPRTGWLAAGAIVAALLAGHLDLVLLVLLAFGAAVLAAVAAALVAAAAIPAAILLTGGGGDEPTGARSGGDPSGRGTGGGGGGGAGGGAGSPGVTVPQKPSAPSVTHTAVRSGARLPLVATSVWGPRWVSVTCARPSASVVAPPTLAPCEGANDVVPV